MRSLQSLLFIWPNILEQPRVQWTGVGVYTGAAMASIAANEHVAVVDANVMRILARLRCLDWSLKSIKRYSKVAEVLLDPQRPGDFNQASSQAKP